MLLAVVVFTVFVSATVFIFQYMSDIQRDAYMDEIFHVPQGQRYCASNFTEWDPMITTLPGLYFVSVGILKPAASLLNVSHMAMCSTYWLRSINVMFAAGNFYLIYAVIKKLHNPLLDTNGGMKSAMTTLALSLFPILYFFSFLFYTDQGSTFFVLVMYLFCVHDNHWMAAMMGVIAIVFRQTNIIWVIFCGGLAVRRELLLWMKDIYQKKEKEEEKKFGDLNDWELLKATVQTLINCALNKRKMLMGFIWKMLKVVLGYIIVGVGFALFVIMNNGIVVGDRNQHVACLNFPQLFYFLSMTNFFAIFQLTSPYKVIDFLKFCWKRPLLVILFCTVAFLMVHFFTYEHKYLLSDNRHYAFYVWHKLYKRHEYVKFVLIPVYLYCTWTFVTEISHRDVFWKIVYFLCLFAATVPQKLLEYRYFIVPYLIYRINMRYSTAVGLLHEILLYIAVNAVTVYLFTQRPFKWPHEDGLQRFMW